VTAVVLAGFGWAAALGGMAMALAGRRTLARRADCVARASHELRGGIGAARLGLALAGRTGELPHARLRALELELDRAALALEELDGRTPEWGIEHVDVGELLADSVEAWHAAAAVRGAKLRLRWTGAAGVVVGDRVRLAQATGNLIANAIEHGGGMVEVRGRLDGPVVRIEVSDQGPGLPAPVTELTHRRSKPDGRGRGLGIAADVVSGHGGRLSAAPSPRGARLVIELPKRPDLQRTLRVG
jgi:signal transduction histidine kinase